MYSIEYILNMKRLFRYLLLIAIAIFLVDTAMAQTTQKWREMHKVKRKETIFGIAKEYGITIEELVKANPDMNMPGYELKKGDFIFIPWPKEETVVGKTKTDEAAVTEKGKAVSTQRSVSNVNVTGGKIRVGIMLPLHDDNGDGRRMVEYYRGVLMACDSLKQDGISIDVYAWNVAENVDIQKALKNNNAALCDLIIGPLYSKQVKPLSDFALAHDIKVLIPFSITAPELFTNRNIFQVYQNTNDLNEATINRYMEKFSGYHTVFIDCNDSTSKKGIFTFGLRRRMEQMGREYSLTNLKTSEAQFVKAFSRTLPNVVILNTGRSPELNVAFAKINNMTMNAPELQISMFGYTEWMMYTKYQLDNFYKYDTYIPATFYMNPLSSQTARIQQKYRWNFHADMMDALPRFAITGFDQAYFFLKGIHLYGKNFTGASGMVGYTPIQTPLNFERIGNGGLQNRALLFVHYTPGHRIETIKF